MHPFRPEPGRPEPGGTDPGLGSWLAERLFDRRVVVVRGPLTLDAIGPDPVQLHLTAADGDLVAAFTVVDAIDAMRAPLHAIVTAQAGGGALAVLAAADRRLAYRHARIRLSEPRAETVSGT